MYDNQLVIVWLVATEVPMQEVPRYIDDFPIESSSRIWYTCNRLRYRHQGRRSTFKSKPTGPQLEALETRRAGIVSLHRPP